MKMKKFPKLNQKKDAIGIGALIALTIAFALMFSQISSASLTFQGRACSGNSVCDVIRECGPDGCTSRFENCQSCGVTTKTCPTGIVTAPKVCVDSGGTPQCREGTPVCPAAGTTTSSSDPFTTLTFTVFTKKNLILAITPETQTGLAGRTLNYKVSVENKNPTTLSFQIASEIPGNWQINIPQQVSVNANSKGEVQFRVTSNETASDASYPILIGLFNSELNLFGTATATYAVASRGAPTIAADPKSQQGYPGQSVFYNVSLTNNDPADFDAATITVRAAVPAGFNAVFTPNNLRLPPGETGYVRLDVTSPANSTESTNRITLNATANRLTAVEFIEYVVDFCGNGVCDLEEENSCLKDCPADINFVCDGRCERELDDGLTFLATVNVPFSKFVVCNRNSTLSACVQASGALANTSGFPGLNRTANLTDSCGIGRPCLCTSSQPNCNARCVDTKGVYYLAASGSNNVRGIVNYSYACPFVNLPEIKALRDSFANAKQEYEKAKSALLESLKAPNLTLQRRSEGQPCVDGLSSIISNAGDYVNYLDAVLAWPGKINTTAARSRANDVRSNVERTYNSFCLGVSGLLQIESITAAPVEKNQRGELTVVANNLGSAPYFGFVQCDFTGGQGEKASLNNSCEAIARRQAFRFDVNASSAGRWTARCKVFGSLTSDCAVATVHHESTVQFNVSTRETFIVDVSASCSQNLTCTVRASQIGCAACSVAGQACTKVGAVNDSEMFACPRIQFGTHNVTGYVLQNARCTPLAPAEKSISVRCAGCGDGTVDSGEQCETPYTNNNQKCQQQQTTCEGKLFGVRDDFGFCTTACGCSPDQYTFSCTQGQCGAECQDEETRTVSVNTTGQCTCTQQCGGNCVWNPCGCEPGQTAIPSGPLSVNVSHSVAGSQVTLTATGRGFSSLEIYVDGFIVKSCSSLPCTITATYDPGTHSYFARAVALTAATDPPQGTKSFTIAGQANGTATALGTSSIIVDVNHNPVGITTADAVTITATAHGPHSFREVNIFVDDSLRKTCSNSPSSQPCTFRSTYGAGTHNYYASVVDAANNSGRDPAGGSKSFAVTAPSATTTPSTTTPSGSQPFGRCYAKIESRNCTYNPNTRRYDVSLFAAWDNGTHAHWDIEDNEGPRMYVRNFTHVEQMSGPGLKNIKVEVHNGTDNAVHGTLCFDATEIYCGPGTSTGKDLDLIIDVKGVLKTGNTDLRVVAVPYADISGARIQSYIESPINVANYRVEGNTSIAGTSGPIRTAEDRSYNVYTTTTNLAARGNTSIVYRLNIDQPGEYKLIAVANYSGKSERITKTIKVTNCPQAYGVLAVGPSGACVDFTTPCDVPAGWDIVDACPEELPAEEDNTLLIITVIILLVVLLALSYRYRDRIGERLSKLKRKKKVQEEMPSFE